MKIAIFEDNKEDIQILLDYLKVLQQKVRIRFEVTIIKDFNHLQEVIKEIDLLFMDVELTNDNGINVGKIIRSNNYNCKIVIVSAYQKYLIDGYKIKAERYFLKPINKVEFLLEMKSIIEEYFYKEYGFVDEKISRDKIVIHKIMYVEFINRKTILYCDGNKKYVTPYPLRYWSDMLLKYGFIQCYKSILVNSHYVKEIDRIDVILKNEKRIPISRHYKKEFEEAYYKCISKLV